MSMTACATLLLVLVSGPIGSVPAQQADQPILIDGAKNPELIPEYVLWEFGFSALASIKARNMTAAMESLHLSPPDLALVWKEAALQHEREAQSMASQRRCRESLAARGIPLEKGLPELQEVILEYRWSVLHARDRLLAAMTTEGQAVLLAWIEESRASTKASIPRSDWEFYRKPR